MTDSTVKTEVLRTFETGATRDSDVGKLDYEGFFSPLVMERFATYMNVHRLQTDGKLRDSDNWQKGMPRTQYMKSLWRHFMDLWKLHRGIPASDSKTGKAITVEEALCAILFNVQGYLLEQLKSASLNDLKDCGNQLQTQCSEPAPLGVYARLFGDQAMYDMERHAGRALPCGPDANGTSQLPPSARRRGTAGWPQ